VAVGYRMYYCPVVYILTDVVVYDAGTTVEQDGRWGKSDEKMIAKMTKAGMFAPILETKVDLKKVNIDIISKWICEKVTDILGFDDDIINNLIVNLLNAEVCPLQFLCYVVA
jgi:hypothetical protein